MSRQELDHLQLQWCQLFEGLVPEGRNSSALAMELRLSCANPSTYGIRDHMDNDIDIPY